MIPVFRNPEINDYNAVHELLSNTRIMSCDYNFASIYLWSGFYEQKIAFLNDMFFSKVNGRMGEAFLCPVGDGNLKEAVEALMFFCETKGMRFVLVCVTDEQRTWLEQLFPGEFIYEEDRDAWDYVYSVQKLAELSGRQLHGKRNHINTFVTNNPGWKFEIIKKEDVLTCKYVLERWTLEKRKAGLSDIDLRGEPLLVNQAFDLMEELRLVCGTVVVEGKVVAFSIGSFTNPDCFNIHIEKADGTVQGSYQMINREMARYVQKTYPKVKWINREDDMGIEGLRKSKESYLPEIMIRKYVAIYTG